VGRLGTSGHGCEKESHRDSCGGFFSLFFGRFFGLFSLGANLGAKWGQTAPNTGKNQLTRGKYVVEKTGAPTVIYGSGTKGQRFESSRAYLEGRC
jgi:hypothetical protein